MFLKVSKKNVGKISKKKTFFSFCPFITLDQFEFCLLCKGGIAQGPYLEAHGGSTYCAVASLYLMDRLEDGLSACQRSQLVRWLVNRQRQGLNGRPDKDDDTCYTFWIGKFLKLMGCN